MLNVAYQSSFRLILVPDMTTESILYSSMETSAPQTVIESDYKLALKHFVNKDFGKSYPTIVKLHDTCYRNFERNIITEALFIKIVALYLTQVGVLLNPLEANASFRLPIPERKRLLQSIEDNSVYNTLAQFYGGIREVPSELLYHAFLLNYACRKSVSDPQSIAAEFQRVYYSLDFDTDNASNDRYLKRFVDIYVFNVLPDNEEFDLALQVAKGNPLLDSEKAETKLKGIRELRRQEKDSKENMTKAKMEEEKQRSMLEMEKKKRAKEEADLKYRSLKQIKQEHEKERTLKSNHLPLSHDKSNTSHINQLSLRAQYVMNLSKSFFIKNYTVILVILAMGFISTKLLRTRRINIKEKLRETLSMAFKVTYL